MKNIQTEEEERGRASIRRNCRRLGVQDEK
jgi:hypothetical protein